MLGAIHSVAGYQTSSIMHYINVKNSDVMPSLMTPVLFWWTRGEMWRINQILPTTSQKSAFSWYISYIFLPFLGERWDGVTFMGGHNRAWSNMRAGGWNFGATREWTSALTSRLKSGGGGLIWIRNAPPPPPQWWEGAASPSGGTTPLWVEVQESDCKREKRAGTHGCSVRRGSG